MLAVLRRAVRHDGTTTAWWGWWQHAEQVVATWAGTVEVQEPRCLEVVPGRDVVQKSLVAGPRWCCWPRGAPSPRVPRG